MALRLTLVLCLCVLTIPGDAAFWNVEPVPSGGFVSGDTSLAIGPSDTPNVSYTTFGTLVYASKSAQDWNVETVTSVGFWGGLSSLEIGPSGEVCIAFIDASGYDQNLLKIATKTGSVWSVETIDDVGWLPERVSLVLTPTGQVRVAYCRSRSVGFATVYHVSLARRTGTGWTTEDIAPVGDSTSPVAVVDKDGIVNVCFTDAISGQLKLASQLSPSVWTVRVLAGDSSQPVMPYVSISAIPTGGVAVAYFRRQAGSAQLKYAVAKGDSFSSQSIATTEEESPYQCSLAISLQGNPLIAYRDSGANCLKHAWQAGGSWLTETVDASPGSGAGVSLAVDTVGTVAAAYVDRSADEVRYARAVAPMSAGAVKSKPTGSTVQLSGVVASSASGEIASLLYVQDRDRSSGIQLKFSAQVPTVTRGMLLDIKGAVTSSSGECAVLDPIVMQIGTLTAPEPMGTTIRSVGGGDYCWNPGPPTVGQMGVRGGSGLNNIGLLITVTGRVETVGTDYFTLNDGSGVPLKCWCPGIVPPAPNRPARVTGISSCEPEGAELIQLLRVRCAKDIEVLPG